MRRLRRQSFISDHPQDWVHATVPKKVPRSRDTLKTHTEKESAYFSKTSNGTGLLMVKLPITPVLPPETSTICISAVFW